MDPPSETTNGGAQVPFGPQAGRLRLLEARGRSGGGESLGFGIGSRSSFDDFILEGHGGEATCTALGLGGC